MESHHQEAWHGLQTVQGGVRGDRPHCYWHWQVPVFDMPGRSEAHAPSCVDKHLKTHSLNWIQYLDWFKKKNITLEDHETEVGQGAVSSEKDSVEKNFIPEPSMKRSKPFNIRDKTNKYCSYCVVTFNTRMMFLQHCQEFHDTRFRNKSGGLMMLGKTNLSIEESHESHFILDPIEIGVLSRLPK